MGADMIGYIVIGPEVIEDAAIERAADKLMQMKAEITTGDWSVGCESCGETLLDSESEDSLYEQEYLKCEDGCGNKAINPVAIKDRAHAIEIVRKLIADWPPDFRDVSTRTMPKEFDPDDKYLICFAGDMSWGDAPMGRGYEVLRDLSCSRIYAELGFK